MNNDYLIDKKQLSCTNEQITMDKEPNKNGIIEMKMSNKDINHMEEVIIGTGTRNDLSY